MQQQTTTTQGSKAIDARPQAASHRTPSLARPIMTAMLLASATLALSGLVATILPILGDASPQHAMGTPAAPLAMRSPHTSPNPAPRPAAAPAVLSRLFITTAKALAQFEQRFDAAAARFVPPNPPVVTYASPAVTAPSIVSYTAPPPSASTVIYLVDASGSLLDSLPQVIDWLGASLDALAPDHRFTVLFFREGQIFEPPPQGLKPASFGAKATVWTWVQPERGNVLPQGRSDLLSAIEAAMLYQPNELVVVSDDSFGGRGDGAALLTKISALLGPTPPRVHTVQFFYRDEAGALEAIADRFGGTYRYIAPADRNPTAAAEPLLELSIAN